MAPVKEIQQYFAQCIAEFFSTFMLILIGESAIAQYKFNRSEYHSTLIINLSFGIGVYTGKECFDFFVHQPVDLLFHSPRESS
jgi:glycerol uptake facilitator-like aquaporin